MSNLDNLRLNPIGIHFRKMLPIIFNDYMSGTEILNAVVDKYNVLIDNFDRLIDKYEDFRQDQEELIREFQILKDEVQILRDSIVRYKDEVRDEFERIENILNDYNASFADINNRLLQLQKSYDIFVYQTNASFGQISDQFDFVWQKYDDLKLYIDRKDRAILQTVKNDYYRLIKYIDKKIDEISSNNLLVINPINGVTITLQKFLDWICEYFGDGLTANEYRALDLTADQYKSLNLTADMYRHFKIWRHRLDLIPSYSKKEHVFDLLGNKVKNPISSVYGVFGYGVDGTLNAFDLTANQYKIFSDRHNATELDKYGTFILSNHFPALIRTPVLLESDPIVTPEHNKTTWFGEISTVLRLPVEISDSSVDTHELLTDLSLKNIFIQYSIKPVWDDPGEGYVFDKMVNLVFTVCNERFTLVDGGIALNAEVFLNMEKIFRQGDISKRISGIFIIDIIAQTQVYL